MKTKLFLLIITFSHCMMQHVNGQMIPNPFPKTITVSGSAEIDVVPDEIFVLVDLKEYKKGGGKLDIETIKNNFLASCKSIGIADSLITIASYEGNNYNYWRWKKKRDQELYAGISYQVKFKDSKKMDELIDKLDDEATTNFRVIRTTHSQIKEFRKQLKIEAVKQAKQKGIYLTEAIDEKLGEAITIQEPDENSMYYYTLNKTSNVALQENKRMDGSSVDEAAAIDFKKITLKYDVTIVFALK